MRPFPTPAATWQPGETRLHVYALPSRDENTDLLQLIDRAAAVCARYRDTNVPVSEEWLHATVRMVARDARSIDQQQRAELVDGLAEELGELGTFALEARELIATGAGVMLAFDGDRPGGAWHELSERVRGAIGRACGTEALNYQPAPPHVSLTYCSHPTDSAPIQEALRADVGRPWPQVAFSVSAVHLVDVVQNATEHTYTWRHVARVPLGAG